MRHSECGTYYLEPGPLNLELGDFWPTVAGPPFLSGSRVVRGARRAAAGQKGMSA